MPAHLQVFDDLGNLWDGASPRLRAAFGSAATVEEFSTYVVKNMGFIAIHSYGRSCEIRLRPQVVNATAFAALRVWMAERAYERIVTACFDADWNYGLHATQQKALAKLETIISSARGVRPGDYLVRSLLKEELPRTTPLHQALHSLIENWPMLSQSVHQDGLSNIITQSLQGRYHLIDADADNHRMIFREIGDGFVSYTAEWAMQAIGKPISEQDDRAYGQWVESVYRQVLATGLPAVADVDVVVTTSKLGRTRLRYKRVLLPARTLGGGMWLLNSSIIDPSIDLRAELLKKSA